MNSVHNTYMQCPEEDMHIHILYVVIDMHHYINITLINTFQINHAVVYICMCYTKIVIHKYIYLYNCLLYLACIVIMLKPMAS